MSNMPSILLAAGVSDAAASRWAEAIPKPAASYAADRRNYADFWLQSAALIEQLPAASQRTAVQQKAVEAINETAREKRTQFLRDHVEMTYDALTDGGTRRVRVQHLVTAAADVVPGLVPSAQDHRGGGGPAAARSQRR